MQVRSAVSIYMKFIKHNYLFRLYKTNKLLFVVVCLFVSLNLLFNLVYKSQVTPIFQWSMYSQPLPDQQVYSILEIRYNENILIAFPHTWEEPRKVLFTNTSWLFMNLKSNGPDYVKDHYINRWMPQHPLFGRLFTGFKNYNDVDELKKFPLWLKRYLEQETGEKIYKIDLYKVNVAFGQSGSVKKISSTLVHTIK